MSEGEKRKQEDKNNDAPAVQKKQREDEEGKQTGVTDAEVDEFYSIIRRIHVAVEYFKEGNKDGRKPTDIESTGMKKEVGGDDGDENASGDRRDVKESVGLDLNADPESE